MSCGLRERTIDGMIVIEAGLLVATALRLDAGRLTADEDILAWSGPLERYDARR